MKLKTIQLRARHLAIELSASANYFSVALEHQPSIIDLIHLVIQPKHFT